MSTSTRKIIDKLIANGVGVGLGRPTIRIRIFVGGGASPAPTNNKYKIQAKILIFENEYSFVKN